jgi:hypothetical protein
MQLEQSLNYWVKKEFNWDWAYRQWVLGSLLDRSPVFGGTPQETVKLPPEYRALQDKIAGIKSKYRRQFEDLENVVAEYGGMRWLGCVSFGSLVEGNKVTA